jgi:MFS family permease
VTPSAITAARLIAMTGLTNLAFWLLWPASLVRMSGSGGDPAAAGLFGSAAWLAMLSALPIASRLVASVGPRRVVHAAVAIIAVGAIGTAASLGGPAEWLWTALLGFGTGLRWIAADSWIADTVPPERSGRVLSLGEMVVGVGFAAGPAVAALIAASGSTAGPGLGAALLALIGGAVMTGAVEPARTRRARPAAPTAGSRLAGLPTGAALLLLASAALGGLNESGFAGIAALLSLATGGGETGSLFAAAAVGLGSFATQYGLGAAADRWGGCKILLICAAVLAAALATLALVPEALPLASLLVGAFGGGLYTVVVVFGLQSRERADGSSGMIGAAALAYTLGTLVAPTLAGAGLRLAGPAPTLIGLALLAAALFAAMVRLQGWRWTDRTRDVGPVCAFRFSPGSAGPPLDQGREPSSRSLDG